jgi:hypothetical protein
LKKNEQLEDRGKNIASAQRKKLRKCGGNSTILVIMRCGVLILFKELNIGTVQITDLSKHTSEGQKNIVMTKMK